MSSLLYLLLLGLAAAAPPLGLVAEPSDFPGAYSATAEGLGRAGAASQPDCRPAFDGLLFCLTIVTPDGWNYATLGDLKRLGLGSEQAHSQAAERLRSLSVADRFGAQAVEGLPGRYHAAALNDGQDAAPLLVPETLAVVLGGPLVVAIPAQGAVVAWVPGNPVMDKVLAVGVRRMYDEAKHGISPKLYRWSKDGWIVWGEAVKPGTE